MQVDDAVILVTGASRGIGAATARLLRARGARLLLHGRDRSALTALAHELEATVLRCDLTEAGTPAELGVRAISVHDRLDGVVHNAGIGWFGGLAEMPADRLETVLRLDLQAPIELTRAVLPTMLAAGRGHLSFVGSIAGLTGVAGEAVYAAAKAGLITFADSLRLELAGSGVGVSTVNPGAVATDFFTVRGAAYDRAIPRPVPASAIADAVLRAIERDRPRTVIPRWLAIAPTVRALAPAAYDVLARRLG